MSRELAKLAEVGIVKDSAHVRNVVIDLLAGQSTEDGVDCLWCDAVFPDDHAPPCPFRRALAYLRSTRREVPLPLEGIGELLVEALETDGEQSKQWYLEQLAVALGVALPEHEPGVAP